MCLRVRHPGMLMGTSERLPAVTLRIRGALWLDGLASSVIYRLRRLLLKLGLVGNGARNRLRLHQTQEILFGCVTTRIVGLIHCRCCCT